MAKSTTDPLRYFQLTMSPKSRPKRFSLEVATNSGGDDSFGMDFEFSSNESTEILAILNRLNQDPSLQIRAEVVGKRLIRLLQPSD